MLGADIHGSTLGILGMGRIGQGIARRGALVRPPAAGAAVHPGVASPDRCRRAGEDEAVGHAGEHRPWRPGR
ncbi:hypothetical protein G6F24_018142 [Rhizopus arrhizus]|nr:hypothetical protein G6F24_018142 [Rhizopus arrhizus]